MPRLWWAYGKEAAAHRAIGGDMEARALYGKVRELNPDDPYGMLAFADLAAAHPEWQLTADERAWLSRDEWEWRGNPWNSFQPSPTGSIDVGTGRDIPYILGFHRPDREPAIDYRWSMGRSHIRLSPRAASDGAAPATLVLRMSAPAVGPSEPMPVTVTINGISETIQVGVGWVDYSFPVSLISDSPLEVTIESPTRDLSVLQPEGTDKRKLGVGLDRVTLGTEIP
jgi:hypothetical protein